MAVHVMRLLAALALAMTTAAVACAQERAAARAQPPAASPGRIPAAELEAFVDGLATEAMARDHIAGAAVTVVQDGQVLLAKGYGVDRLAPARPVDPNRTLFRLGGISSTFTWIALMREIEAGHIRLDAPINVYLPQKDQVPDQGRKRAIVVRDLLGHTAGFEDRVAGQLIEKSPERIRPLELYLRQERPRRVREPGELPTFSYYGVALAGEALAQVTGKMPQALADLDVIGPLGLRRTTLREPYPRRGDLAGPMGPALAGDVSQGFRWTDSAYQARPFEFMTQVAPAASGSSTAADMGRYLLAILADGSLDGAMIYSPAIARDFRTPLTTGGPAFDYGFQEYLLPGGLKGYGHDGSTLSFRSRLIAMPDLKLGVFVTANTETADAFVSELPARIVQRFVAGPAPPAPRPSAWLEDNASAFAGDYLTTRRAYHGLEGFVDLLDAGARVSVSGGVLSTPGPGGRRRWSPDAGASVDAPFVSFHRVDGPERLVFQMQDGRAIRFFAPSAEAAFERTGPLAYRGLLAILAATVALASVGVIGGVFLRDRREFRQTSVQGRADAAQISAAVLWLAAMACFFAWRGGDADPAVRMYQWPGAWLLIGSACAFVATVMTVLCLGMAPVAWRGGRRLDSWTTWRKARFTFTTVAFTLFAVLIALWGGLEPWSR